MLQSRKLFESIIPHPSFKEANFLLILNKVDLLEDFNPVYSRHQNSKPNGSGNSIAPLAQRAFHYLAVKNKIFFKSSTGRKLYVCPVTTLTSLKPDTVDSTIRYATENVRWEEDYTMCFSFNELSSESIDINKTSYS